MMATIQLCRELSQNSQAVRKRQSRAVQREKRRRTFFVHDFIRTKYPTMYNEANAMYQTLVEKYPHKPDFTKLYYFKKWQKEMDKSKACLMVPHLPILSSPTAIHKISADQQNQEIVQQSNEQETNQQDEEIVQQSDEQEPGHQLLEEVVQCSNQNPEEIDLFGEMSIDEIDSAVEKIIKDLQAADELRNIQHEFDLPDEIWENELFIPDNLLETELQW